MRGRVKERWGKLTDDDLTAIAGGPDQLEGMIQDRYGYARERARREIEDWYRLMESNLSEQIELLRSGIRSLASTVDRIAKGQMPYARARTMGAITINGVRVGEIGLELASFMGARLLAVVGEEAAVVEAKALCPRVVGIPVKSLEKNWFPSADETRPVIRREVLRALHGRDKAGGLNLEPPFRFTLSPADGYVFDREQKMPRRWFCRLLFFGLSKGRLGAREASWEAKTVVRGIWALHCVRGFLRKEAK